MLRVLHALATYPFFQVRFRLGAAASDAQLLPSHFVALHAASSVLEAVPVAMDQKVYTVSKTINLIHTQLVRVALLF